MLDKPIPVMLTNKTYETNNMDDIGKQDVEAWRFSDKHDSNQDASAK